MVSSRRRNRLVASTLLLMLSWVGPSTAAARAETIRNISPTPHLVPAGTPLVDLAAAIKVAADELNWTVMREVPGVILLSLEVRAHEAVVIVGYDESNYWIDYSDSFNLDYSPKDRKLAGRNRRVIKGPRIHHNYNLWVGKLAKRIERRAKSPPRVIMADPASSRKPILVADELEKLDALRERGVLSQEEFDRQKLKLLAQ